MQVVSVTRQMVSGNLYTVEFEVGTTECVKNQEKLAHEKLHLCAIKQGKNSTKFQ